MGVAVGAAAREISVLYRSITIWVDGRRVATETEPFLVVDEGRTYVPARALAEALGARVSWDETRSAVLVSTPGHWEEQTHGDVTTYRFPYWGASIQWPAGGVATSLPDLLLHVDHPTAVMTISRVESGSLGGVESAVSAYLKGMESTLSVAVTRRTPLDLAGAEGALDLTATARIQTTDVQMRLRAIQADDAVWYLAFFYHPQDAALAEAVIDRAVESFRLVPE